MSKILQRKEKLEWARQELKNEFVGIDDPIDEIIELVHSWYCFPEGQIRPTVINLVGMTGVGKTSLIEKLFSLLELDKVLYKFDMGYYASNTENLKHELSKKVKSFDGAPICFTLDEFQLCRSIDSEGGEIDRSNFRPIWDLLDNGKLNLIEPNYGIDTLQLLVNKLEYCIEKGLTSKGLRILKGEDQFVDLFGKEAYDETDFDDDEEEKKEKKSRPSIIPSGYFYYINQCVPNRFLGDGDLRNYLNALKDEDSIVNFIKETIEQGSRPKTYDFSSSIIFVIANIDEAFTGSKDMDPDMDADELHKHSLDISLFDVKQSLSKRFRSEQIARLGNNYVIYPAFSSDTYRKLIDLELARKSNAVKEKFGVEISFDDSVKKIIYNEGVFPTQGSRPVFTTVNYIVGSFVGRILSRLEEKGLLKEDTSLLWSFKRNKNIIHVYGPDFSIGPLDVISYDVKIKVESLRRSKKNDEQALTSVHEAGHAVVCAALLDQMPNKVMSSSAGGAEGLNIINWKKLKSLDYTESMAAVYLAGIEAEKLVFGRNKATSFGAQSDMAAVTQLVTNMVQQSGLYYPGMYHPRPSEDSIERVFDHRHITTSLVDEVLKRAKEKAVSTLTKHKKALIALSLELFRHPVLDKKKVAKIFFENGLHINGDGDGSYVDKLLSFEEESEPINSVADREI